MLALLTYVNRNCYRDLLHAALTDTSDYKKY